MFVFLNIYIFSFRSIQLLNPQYFNSVNTLTFLDFRGFYSAHVGITMDTIQHERTPSLNSKRLGFYLTFDLNMLTFYS